MAKASKDATKMITEQGPEIAEAKLPIHRDERLVLTMGWASGETADGRKFEVLQNLGGFSIVVSLDGKRYSCDLNPILHSLLLAVPKE